MFVDLAQTQFLFENLRNLLANVAQIMLTAFVNITKNLVLIDFYCKKIYNYSVIAVSKFLSIY